MPLVGAAPPWPVLGRGPRCVRGGPSAPLDPSSPLAGGGRPAGPGGAPGCAAASSAPRGPWWAPALFRVRVPGAWDASGRASKVRAPSLGAAQASGTAVSAAEWSPAVERRERGAAPRTRLTSRRLVGCLGVGGIVTSGPRPGGGGGVGHMGRALGRAERLDVGRTPTPALSVVRPRVPGRAAGGRAGVASARGSRAGGRLPFARRASPAPDSLVSLQPAPPRP